MLSYHIRYMHARTLFDARQKDSFMYPSAAPAAYRLKLIISSYNLEISTCLETKIDYTHTFFSHDSGLAEETAKYPTEDIRYTWHGCRKVFVTIPESSDATV